MLKAVFLSGLFYIVLPTSTSLAQPGRPEQQDWQISLSAALVSSPSYLGDDEQQLSLFPSIRVEYKDFFFASIEQGVGFNLVSSENWRIGPILKFDFGREEDAENPFTIQGSDTQDLEGFEEVDPSPELGGFLEYRRRAWSTSIELRQGLDGHEGLIGEWRLAFKGRGAVRGQRLLYSIGPQIIFADSDYNNAYFGVSVEDAQRTGLAFYEADDGIVAAGLASRVTFPVAQTRSALSFLLNAGVLQEEAEQSPLVEERGSETQLTFAVFYTYRL